MPKCQNSRWFTILFHKFNNVISELKRLTSPVDFGCVSSLRHTEICLPSQFYNHFSFCSQAPCTLGNEIAVGYGAPGWLHYFGLTGLLSQMGKALKKNNNIANEWSESRKLGQSHAGRYWQLELEFRFVQWMGLTWSLARDSPSLLKSSNHGKSFNSHQASQIGKGHTTRSQQVLFTGVQT